MGLLSWIGAAAASFLLTRVIEARRRAWWLELIAGLLGAVVAGIVATALDFGGWATADGRAVAFSGISALLAIGVLRARMRR